VSDQRFVAKMAVLAVLLLLAVLPPAHPAAPVCLWNTTAAHIAGLPGCCGWPDGCSCGCCQTNFTANDEAAAPSSQTKRQPAAAENSTAPHTSTTRFLSFYDECPVDLQARPVEAVVRSERAAASAGFESLPLIFGMCMAKMPLWGCWRDQLQVMAKHGSASMIQVRGSGTLICGSAGDSTLHVCADDCSDLDSKLKPLWTGSCGMAWLKSWLEELKPHVAQGPS
jgi:hypothetical protein